MSLKTNILDYKGQNVTWSWRSCPCRGLRQRPGKTCTECKTTHWKYCGKNETCFICINKKCDDYSLEFVFDIGRSVPVGDRLPVFRKLKQMYIDNE